MKEKITIAIDAMSGENSPSKNIRGLSIFLTKNSSKNDFFFNLYGDEKLINEELKKNKILLDNIKIFDSKSVVSDNETPLTAIKT